MHLPCQKPPISLPLTLSFQSLELGKLSSSGSSSNWCKSKAKYVITCISGNSSNSLWSWLTYIMPQHSDGKGRGGSVTDRVVQLLTLLSTRLTVFSFADWRKETKKRVSYLSGFTKKLNYWIMWEHNCCHGNRTLSVLVISLLHQRFTYDFYLVFGRWHILIPISTLESNKRKHSKVSDEVTDVLNSMFSLVSTTEKVAVF